MIRLWLAVGLLAGSWLLGLGYFQPENVAAWVVLVAAGAMLMASRPTHVPSKKQLLLAVALLLPAVWFVPTPYRAGPLLLSIGLTLQIVPIPRRWPRPMGWGCVTAGMVLLVQSVVFCAYRAQTARTHDLPNWLVGMVSTVVKLLGADAVANGGDVVIHTARQVHRLAATWELLVDPVTVCFFAGGTVLMGLAVWNKLPSGQRWTSWLRGVRIFTLVILAWLPIRLALVVSVYLQRSIRDSNEVLTTMNQFLSPWVYLVLLFGPVLAAWRFVRLPCCQTHDGMTEDGVATAGESADNNARSQVAGMPKWKYVVILALATAGSAVAAFIIQWDPVGRRKQGRVVVVERHSTWEPTDQPYDTDHFGHDPSYSYTLIYDYCSRFYEMSRLMESDAISLESLRECDVLVVKIPTARFSAAEVTAIAKYVEQGGGLLLIGDHTNVFDSSTFLNDICRPLGFTFRNDLLFRIGSPYEQLVSPPAVPHPVIQHVPTMHYAVSCSIDPGNSRGRAVVQSTGLWNLPPDYHADNYHPQAEYRPEMRYGSFIQLWSMRHGKGRVLGFTDSTIFSNFCIFQPGKTELMMGMLEWLNHSSALDRDGIRITIVALTLLVGVVLVFISLIMAQREKVAWIVMLSAVILGGTIGSMTVSAVHKSSMPKLKQKPDRPITRVVIDRTVSEVPLSLGAFTQGDGQGYGLLEQWIPRLGYVTMRRSGDQAFTGDALVIIGPSRSVSHKYRERLVEYVEQGGRVIIFDAPTVIGSTANSLLWPFGLASDHSAGKEGVLAFGDGWPGMELTGSSAIIGGEPFLWVDDVPVGARVRRGRGSVTAVGIGSIFNDSVMGVEWTTDPDDDLLTIFDLLFAIVRGAVEDKPMVAPTPRESVAGPTNAATG